MHGKVAQLISGPEYSLHCPRCFGLMVGESYYSPFETFHGTRCVQCGNLMDRVILENRSRSSRISETSWNDTGTEYRQGIKRSSSQSTRRLKKALR